MRSKITTDRLGGFAGVLRKGHGKRESRPSLIAFPQLLQSLHLRVDQGIHGVDHQGRHPVSRRRAPHERIDNGEKVGQAFPRTRAFSSAST